MSWTILRTQTVTTCRLTRFTTVLRTRERPAKTFSESSHTTHFRSIPGFDNQEWRDTIFEYVSSSAHFLLSPNFLPWFCGMYRTNTTRRVVVLRGYYKNTPRTTLLWWDDARTFKRKARSWSVGGKRMCVSWNREGFAAISTHGGLARVCSTSITRFVGWLFAILIDNLFAIKYISILEIV